MCGRLLDQLRDCLREDPLWAAALGGRRAGALAGALYDMQRNETATVRRAGGDVIGVVWWA